MEKPIISVEGIGKWYRLGSFSGAGQNFREAIVNTIKSPFRKTEGGSKKTDNSFWALKDVSFDINEGEVIGVVGNNGAGKSTLLKILSKITEPTQGRVVLRGRVASLLEVGTGFHPELTGKENIYLNGSILGMRKTEIDRKFDDIVEFSEIGKFLDTPVKRYSSGMYVRLAFSVAAHLEPEILIVDEVLAVGDAGFQKKCLGKMSDVAQSGRTVLFVSHNLSAVQNLCTRAIALQKGQLVNDGPTTEVVKDYLSAAKANAGKQAIDDPGRKGNKKVYFTGLTLEDTNGRVLETPIVGEELVMNFSYKNPGKLNKAVAWITLVNHFGVAVSTLDSEILGAEVPLTDEGVIQCRIPRLGLPIGEYHVIAGLRGERELYDFVEPINVFDVSVSAFYPTGELPQIQHSAAVFDHTWKAV